jgi:hypothetical protein
MIRRVGLRRINRELDVANFLRKQITMTALIKALTTKVERSFLKNNFRFMLGDEKELKTTSDS